MYGYKFCIMRITCVVKNNERGMEVKESFEQHARKHTNTHARTHTCTWASRHLTKSDNGLVKIRQRELAKCEAEKRRCCAESIVRILVRLIEYLMCALHGQKIQAIATEKSIYTVQWHTAGCSPRQYSYMYSYI